jgi:hypothetical protein
MTWHTNIWGPCGSHVDSVATSNETGIKTVYGPKVNVVYQVLQLKDDFVTR